MIKNLLIAAVLMISVVCSWADDFNAQSTCQDGSRTCLSSGTRMIDGFSVTKDCWEWSYHKTCNYPSLDNCKLYSHCYLVADLPCLLTDYYGNCVNLQKEFACKSWQPAVTPQEMVKTSLAAKAGPKQLLCKGILCLDGNCFDKSYVTDHDMMDIVSKLSAVSQIKGALDINLQLIAGFVQSCSKKATAYSNCCSTKAGWGEMLGAKCTADEIDLVDRRRRNLCVYIGKERRQNFGVTTLVKHHYCCFGSVLNKIIQVQGRRQLGIGFGSAGRPDCRGLSLAEIMQLDFQAMDFSQFHAELLTRMKLPQKADVSARVRASLPNIRQNQNKLPG